MDEFAAIVKMDWKRMHDASVNITHNYLSAEAMSNQYQGIYNELLEQNRRHRLGQYLPSEQPRKYRRIAKFRNECDWGL